MDTPQPGATIETDPDDADPDGTDPAHPPTIVDYAHGLLGVLGDQPDVFYTAVSLYWEDGAGSHTLNLSKNDDVNRSLLEASEQ